MEGALLTLAVLACPVGMGVMMWLMMRGQRGDTPAQTPTTQPDEEITASRAEIEQLKADRSQRSAAGEH